MRWVALIVSMFVVSGCGQPSAHFSGLPATQVSVGGSDFDIRVRGELAEAIRRNPQYAPRLGPIRARAAVAMQHVSGCKVEHVLGDAAVTLGLLDCDGKARDWRVVMLNRGYNCYEVGGATRGGYTTFECDPY